MALTAAVWLVFCHRPRAARDSDPLATYRLATVMDLGEQDWSNSGALARASGGPRTRPTPGTREPPLWQCASARRTAQAGLPPWSSPRPALRSSIHPTPTLSVLANLSWEPRTPCLGNGLLHGSNVDLEVALRLLPHLPLAAPPGSCECDCPSHAGGAPAALAQDMRHVGISLHRRNH
jgi:hypothetical protein